MATTTDINKHICLNNFSNILFFKNTRADHGWFPERSLREYFSEADFRYSEMRFNFVSPEEGVYKGLTSADMMAPILYLYFDYTLSVDELNDLEEFLWNRHRKFKTTIVSSATSDPSILYERLENADTPPRFRTSYSADKLLRHALSDFLEQEIELLNPEAEILGFIDIDGVLQNIPQFFKTGWAGMTATSFQANPLLVSASYHRSTADFLKSLSFKAGVKWVMCSAQRKIFTDDEIKLWGKLLGIDVIGKTMSLGTRSEEILAYIEEFGHKGKIIVMDDEKFEHDGNLDVFQPTVGFRNPITVDEMAQAFKHCDSYIRVAYQGIDF